MIFLTVLIIIALIIAGLFHFYWAFGGDMGINKAIPTKDGKALLNPSKASTFVVGLVLFGFAFIAYLLHFYDLNSTSYGKYIIYSGWFLSGIFIIRAIGDFNAVGVFKKIKTTEFARYDTKYYVPLCMILSVAFAVLAY